MPRVNGPLCYRHNTKLFVRKLGSGPRSKWVAFFLGSSTRILKAVLLHNGNIKPSVSVAHSVLTKALKSSSMPFCIVIANVRFVEALGSSAVYKDGFTKHRCFLYLWDSRATAKRYVRKDRPTRDSNVKCIANIQSVTLFETKNVFMPLLHIKPRLIKNFVKALKSNSNAFVFLCHKFP